MCEWGTWKKVIVRMPADLSYTGYSRWKSVGIDSCIADLVNALQRGGINMRGSCCGHNKVPGVITLDDGRDLLITPHLKHFKGSLCLWHLKQSWTYLGYWFWQRVEDTKHRILGR